MIRKLFFLLVVTIYQIESMENDIEVKIENIDDKYEDHEKNLKNFLLAEKNPYAVKEKPLGKNLLTDRLFQHCNKQNEEEVKKVIKANLPYTEKDIVRQQLTKDIPNNVLACIRNYFLTVYVQSPYDVYLQTKKIFFQNFRNETLKNFISDPKNIFYNVLTKENYKFFYNLLDAGIFRFINQFNPKKIGREKREKKFLPLQKQKLDKITKKKIQDEILQVELEMKSPNLNISDKLKILEKNLDNFEKIYQNDVRKQVCFTVELKSKIRFEILKKIKELISENKPEKNFLVNKNIYTTAQNSVFKKLIDDKNKNNCFSFTANDTFLQLLRSIFEEDIKELKNNIKQTIKSNSSVALENLKNEARNTIIEGSQNNNITMIEKGINYLYLIFKETYLKETKKNLYNDYHTLKDVITDNNKDINFLKKTLISRINNNSQHSIFYLSLKPIVESIQLLENNIANHNQSDNYSDNKQIKNKKRRQQSVDNSDFEDNAQYGDLITKKSCIKNNNKEIAVKIEEPDSDEHEENL